ncbi:MAG: hypothetical protein IIA20_03330, partial [Thaumarchaeota archaeon]|nr:hypothetical protein [Nitrososphaerota archaeon]
MNKLILIPILLGITVVVSVSLLTISENPSQPQSKQIYEMGFTYYDVEKIKTSLAKQ